MTAELTDRQRLNKLAHDIAGAYALVNGTATLIRRDMDNIDMEALATRLESYACKLQALHFLARGSDEAYAQAMEAYRARPRVYSVLKAKRGG